MDTQNDLNISDVVRIKPMGLILNDLHVNEEHEIVGNSVDRDIDHVRKIAGSVQSIKAIDEDGDIFLFGWFGSFPHELVQGVVGIAVPRELVGQNVLIKTEQELKDTLDVEGIEPHCEFIGESTSRKVSQLEKIAGTVQNISGMNRNGDIYLRGWSAVFPHEIVNSVVQDEQSSVVQHG